MLREGGRGGTYRDGEYQYHRDSAHSGPGESHPHYLNAAERARDTDIRREPERRHRPKFPPSNRRNNPRDDLESRENGGRIPCVLYQYQRAGGRRYLYARGRGELLSAAIV